MCRYFSFEYTLLGIERPSCSADAPCFFLILCTLYKQPFESKGQASRTPSEMFSTAWVIVLCFHVIIPGRATHICSWQAAFDRLRQGYHTALSARRFPPAMVGSQGAVSYIPVLRSMTQMDPSNRVCLDANHVLGFQPEYIIQYTFMLAKKRIKAAWATLVTFGSVGYAAAGCL